MKSLLLITKDELYRVLLHIPVGLLTCLLCYVHWGLAIAFTVSFLYYELSQDMHLSDQAFKDIKGFCWGLGIGGITLFILKLLEVIVV